MADAEDVTVRGDLAGSTRPSLAELVSFLFLPLEGVEVVRDLAEDGAGVNRVALGRKDLRLPLFTSLSAANLTCCPFSTEDLNLCPLARFVWASLIWFLN